MLYSPKKGLVDGADRGATAAAGSGGGGGGEGGGATPISPKLQGKVTKMRQEVDRLRRIKAEFRRRMGHLARELEIKDEELRRLLVRKRSLLVWRSSY